MLVDDEVMIIEGLRRLFDWEANGCEIVCIAYDGAEAVNQAERYQPDIVVMDINLPIISGLEAIRIIKEQKVDTAFIVLSGYDEFEYCREALRLKIVDYMLKPVNFEEFKHVIDKIKLNLIDEEQEKQECIKGCEGEERGRIIFRVIAYLQEHLSEDITLQILADKFHLNPTYISQLFKNETGINYYAYLTQLRINKAKAILAVNDEHITHVAQQVGFCDYRVFSKAFKNHTGISPSRYQKYIKDNIG